MAFHKIDKNLKGEIDFYLSKKNIYYSKFSLALKDFLNKRFPNLDIKAQWYMLVNNIDEIPICEVDGCNLSVKWNGKTNSFNRGCSKQHNQQLTFLDNYGTTHPNKNQKHFEKVQQKIKKKSGYKFGQNPESLKKRKQTNLERYGVEEVGQSDEIRDKIRDTVMSKYGVSNILFDKRTREKIRNTNIIKFGSESALGNPLIRDKIYKSNLKKFGTIYPMRNDSVKAKQKQTNIDKYDAYTALIDNKKKNQTMLENFFENKVVNNRYLKPLFTKNDFLSQLSLKYECVKCKNIISSDVRMFHFPHCDACYSRKVSFETIVEDISTTLETESINFKIKNLNYGIILIDLHSVKLFLVDSFRNADNRNNRYVNFNMLYDFIESDHLMVFDAEWLIFKENIMQYIETFTKPRVQLDNTKLEKISLTEFNQFHKNNNIYFEKKEFLNSKGLYGVFFEGQIETVFRLTKYKNKHTIKNFCYNPKFIPNIDVLTNLFEYENISSLTIQIDKRINDKKLFDLLDSKFSFEGLNDISFYHISKDFKVFRNVKNWENVEEINNNQCLTSAEKLELVGCLRVWDIGKYVYKIFRN